MELSQDSSGLGTFVARFDRGPLHGTVTVVLGLETGQPPDLLLAPGHPDGIYVRAGGAHTDGSLPYWWMSRSRLAALRAIGDRPPASRIENTS
jgi:hypothetical protein